MSFLKLYLVVYFVLLFGAVLALWRADILSQIPGIWLALCAVVAIGLGVLLAALSSAPAVTRD